MSTLGFTELNNVTTSNKRMSTLGKHRKPQGQVQSQAHAQAQSQAYEKMPPISQLERYELFTENTASVAPQPQSEHEANMDKFMKYMGNLEKVNHDDDDDLAATEYLKPPTSTSMEKKQELQMPEYTNNFRPKEGFSSTNILAAANSPDNDNLRNYNTIYKPNPKLQQDFNSAISIGNNNSGGSNDKLMEKINYMIHLLEQQNDAKKDNMLEDFVIIGGVGIFIIYIVDSFTKAGKYIR